jgi:periplasmic protein TonB
MFDDLLESAANRKRTKRGWTIVASAVAQSACLAALILIPLLRIEALPIMMLRTVLIAPIPHLPSLPPPQTHPQHVFHPPPRLLQNNVLHEPIAIPKKVTMLVEPELPPDLQTGIGTGDGAEGGLDLLKSMRGTANPSPVVAPPPAVVISRIRIGGQIQAAKVVFDRPPVYPSLARQARIQGTVILHAIINTDGRVAQLQVVSGHPVLARAALDAVRLWRYLPTRLNGQPVEVDTNITVTFILRG